MPDPLEPPELLGHKSCPEASVIVTLLSCSPGTAEATSWAMPRTELGSRAVVPERRTEAVEALWFSPKIWFWELGSTSVTWAPETPWTLLIVDSSWPWRARW